MVSGLSVGTFPSKVTVPLMVDAASASPGHATAAAASPAARHHLFAAFPTLGVLVIANLASLVIVDGAVIPAMWMEGLYIRPRHPGKPHLAAVPAALPIPADSNTLAQTRRR